VSFRKIASSNVVIVNVAAGGEFVVIMNVAAGGEFSDRKPVCRSVAVTRSFGTY
jgi:hypothetical protein